MGTSTAQRVTLDAEHPYPGLESFDEVHRDYFFGRGGEADELFQRVRSRQLTVLHGKSGLGKTSLLQAGVFPKLRDQGFLPLRIRFTFDRVPKAQKPGEEPPQVSLADQVRRRIRDAIKDHELDAEAPDAETLWSYFHFTGFWDARGRAVTPVIVLDQFEEVFTHSGERAGELEELITELSDLVENRIPEAVRATPDARVPPPGKLPRVRVVIALREDFLADLSALRPRMPSLASAGTRLGPLVGDAALDAVLSPAKARDLVDPGVAERIVRLVAGTGKEGPASSEAGQPPPEKRKEGPLPDEEALRPLKELEVESSLLALYCQELNLDRFDEKGNKKRDKIEVRSDSDRILDTFYDRCMKGTPDAARVFVEEKLLTERNRRDTQALDRLQDFRVRRADIDLLVARRLLRIEPRLGQLYVEIVHDVLTRTIAKRRDERRGETALKVRARRVARWALALVLGLGVGAAWFWQRWQDAARSRTNQELSDMNQQRQRVNSAREAASLAAEFTAASRWEDAARALKPAFESILEAQKQHDLHPKGERPRLPLLALLGDRFLSTTRAAKLVASDRAGFRTWVSGRTGRYGAALGGDGRSVTLFDSVTHKTWEAQPASPQPPPDAPRLLADDGVEPTSWFKGLLRDLAISGDASLLFGVGDDGQVVVWRTVDQERLFGFRVRVDHARLSVDRGGRLVVLQDVSGDHALAVPLDEHGVRGRVLPLALQGERRAAEGERSPVWSLLQPTPDGARVVGLRLTPSSDPKTPAQWSCTWHVWSMPDGRVTTAPALGAVQEIKVAQGAEGSMFATASEQATVTLWKREGDRITRDREITPGLTPVSWIAFDESDETLVVASPRAVEGWDIRGSGKPSKRFEARVADARSAMVGGPPSARDLLVRTGRDLELFALDGADDAPLLSLVPMAFPTRGAQLRAESGEALLFSGNALRAVSVAESKDLPGDRVLWAGPARRGSRASASTTIPLVGIRNIEDDEVYGDGERLAFRAGGRVWFAEGLRDVPMLGRQERTELKLNEWEKLAKHALTSLVSMRFTRQHVVAIDDDGYLEFGSRVRAEQRSFLGDVGAHQLFALSEDGKWAVTSGGGAKLKAWSTSNFNPEWEGDVRRTASANTPTLPAVKVTAVAVTSAAFGGRIDVPRVLVGDDQGGVRAMRAFKGALWRMIKPAPGQTSPHQRGVSVIAAYKDERFATGAADGTTALWKIDERENEEELRSQSLGATHAGGTKALRFTHDGAFLVSGGADRIARLWEVSSGRQVCEMREHVGAIVAIEVSPDAHRVISRDASALALLWEWNATQGSCRVLRHFREVIHAGFVTGVSAPRFVTVSEGQLGLWEGERDEEPDLREPRGAMLWGAAIGARLVAGDAEGGAFAWKLDDGSPRPIVAGDVEMKSREVVVVAAQDRVVALTSGGAAFSWEGEAPPEKHALFDGKSRVRAAALSEDGRRLLAMTDAQGKLEANLVSIQGKVWSSAAPVPLSVGTGCGETGSGAGGERVFGASATSNRLRVFVIEPHGCVRIWGERGGAPLLEARPSRGVAVTTAALFDNVMMMADADGAVSFWNVASELSLRGLEPNRHRGLVRALAFHPRGQFAISAGDDGGIWLWDVERSRTLAQLGRHDGSIQWVAFRPSGDEVLTGGSDGYVRRWTTRTELDARRVLDALEQWRLKD
jgi:WD40 repeat protein